MIFKRHGFSLLEALVAMGILSGALILLSNAWGGAFRSIKKGKQQYEVALLLERKLTELELEFRDKPLTEIPEEREEDFGKEYPEVRWKMRSKEFQFPDLTPMIKAQDQGEDNGTSMIFAKLAEVINKSVKEVEVTIMIKDGKKTKSFSAVTYFVDYTQEITL